MKNILLILGSPRRRASCSHQIGRRIVDDLKSHYPSAKVVVRNLAREPLPEVSDVCQSASGRCRAPDRIWGIGTGPGRSRLKNAAQRVLLPFARDMCIAVAQAC